MSHRGEKRITLSISKLLIHSENTGALSAALASVSAAAPSPRPGDFSPMFEPIAHEKGTDLGGKIKPQIGFKMKANHFNFGLEVHLRRAGTYRHTLTKGLLICYFASMFLIITPHSLKLNSNKPFKCNSEFKKSSNLTKVPPLLLHPIHSMCHRFITNYVL